MVKNNESVLLMEAHENYFEGRPHLDQVEIWIWPNYEIGKLIDKLQTDDLYLGNVPLNPKSHKELIQIEQGASYLSFNMKKTGPIQDQRLRTAIHLVIDREKMIKDTQVNALPACSFSPSYSEHHFKNGTNVDMAKVLIAESGYDGEILKLYTYDMPSNIWTAKWLQATFWVNKSRMRAAFGLTWAFQALSGPNQALNLSTEPSII